MFEDELATIVDGLSSDALTQLCAHTNAKMRSAGSHFFNTASARSEGGGGARRRTAQHTNDQKEDEINTYINIYSLMWCLRPPDL